MILQKNLTVVCLKTADLELPSISQRVTQLSSFSLSDDEVDWSTSKTYNYEVPQITRASSVPRKILPALECYELHKYVPLPDKAPAAKKRFTKYQMYKMEKEFKKHQSSLIKHHGHVKKPWRAK